LVLSSGDHRNGAAKYLQRAGVPVFDNFVQGSKAGINEVTQALTNFLASMPIRDAKVADRVLGKQSKPLPNVLSSISFQNASSHWGVSFFVMVRVVISFSSRIVVAIFFS
jgi:hypothetical protein